MFTCNLKEVKHLLYSRVIDNFEYFLPAEQPPFNIARVL